MPAVPEKLGKYEVRREIGRGGMGVVYEGFDPIIHRRVALKTLLSEHFSGTESNEYLERLKREAQAAGRLNHPNIVAIYDFGEATVATDENKEAHMAFIAMEFIEGRELKSILDAHERFEVATIVRIMSQLLDALAYSHERGVIHRDIKPANMIVLASGDIKVADFGIARIEASTLTQAGTVLGSPAYMSPEQFLGQTVDRRSDLYSAAVVFYQLLTGETPFSGSFSNIMHRVLNETPSPPSVLNVHVPAGVDGLLTRAMAKRPADRFQDAQEFKRAIIVACDPTLKGDSTGAATMMRGPASTARTPATPANASRATASRTVLAAAIGAIVVISAGAYFYLAARKSPAPIEVPQSPATDAASAAASDTGSASAASSSAAPSSATSPAGTAEPPALDANTAIISAMGLADPGSNADSAKVTQTLWQDARRQLVAKAAALYIDPRSLNANYALLRDQLLTKSDSFISTVLEQSTPEQTKFGLWAGSMRAEVNVHDVQKALNQISRDRRIEFIRNNGNPRIAVKVRVQSALADPLGEPARSPLAENLLIERIHSFGFVVVDPEQAKPPADFELQGEVRMKRLSARLPASGLTIEKFVLTSWTVRAVDQKSGEQIYDNTKLPDQQSWATEERALSEVGRLIGAEFSRDFFLQYFHFNAQPARLRLRNLPPSAGAAVLQEMNSSLGVLNLSSSKQEGADFVVRADLSGGTKKASQIFEESVIAPINRKAGTTCLSQTAADATEVRVEFDARCAKDPILSRIESLPPQALIGSAAQRIQEVTADPLKLQRTTL